MSKKSVITLSALGLAVLAAVVISDQAGTRFSNLVGYFQHDSLSPGKPEKCEHSATQEQASGLLLRLFPKGVILSAEPMMLGGNTCLLEVEMMVDKDLSNTKGFVYVLPDGKSFLNGPLMDKRSQVGISDVPEDIKNALADQNTRLEAAGLLPAKNLQIEPVAPAPAQSALIQAPAQNFPPAKSVTEIRSGLLGKLKALPAIKSSKPGKPVYVLLDPLCPKCSVLFAQSESLINDLDIQFIWIPTPTTEAGWIMSALIIKTAETDPDAAYQLMSSMMNKKWDLAQHTAEIEGLSEADYATVKRSLILWTDIAKSNPGIGTPFVVFETPKDGIEVIGGVPISDDWDVLRTKPVTPPTLKLQ